MAVEHLFGPSGGLPTHFEDRGYVAKLTYGKKRLFKPTYSEMLNGGPTSSGEEDRAIHGKLVFPPRSMDGTNSFEFTTYKGLSDAEWLFEGLVDMLLDTYEEVYRGVSKHPV